MIMSKDNPKAGRKVLVGMSGGVDSSVAALLLQQQGYEVIGATMDTAYGNAPEQAREVCRDLGLSHYVIDVRQAFRRDVIERFLHAYLHAETPNPCVECNRNIKFSLFLPLMEELGVDYFSTGHYIRCEQKNGRYLLRCAVDEQKDQSYFLYALQQNILSRCLFPLGGMTKTEVRELAAEFGLSSAGQKDSYDICFIPGGDYRELLQKEAPGQLQPGDILDLDGNCLGQHNGLANYTLGQRRGLEIALGTPAYVLDFDLERNALLVGPKTALMRQRVRVCRNNFLAFARLDKPLRVWVKIRYRALSQPATLLPLPAADELEICFDEAQWGVTPGQSAVYYDGEYLLGGGTICRD
ncbi:MAG: tRNA 2-thiouridine(34) synthase MnmA [Bacillota bacterium]|nr:tRNA 2-thiouridine(34) synthase MnmA [Bacillota bacterium]